MANLIRANRVAVKANGEGFIADFYKTHKAVGTIHSEHTDWVAPDTAINKSAMRESFRLWVIENAKEFGINWMPQDLRAESNVRKAKYDSDQALVDDAMALVIPEMRTLVGKCKYPIEWNGIEHDDIVPMTETGSGRELITMGIEDGKYMKTGNWAWAWVKFITNFKYKEEECYIPVTMQLVSGQLKKVGMGITEFNSKVKTEIINAGLATEEELDPPKESKPKKTTKKEVISQEQAEEKINAIINEDTTEDEVTTVEDVAEEQVSEVAVEEEVATVEDITVAEDTDKEVVITQAPKRTRARKSKKTEVVEEQ